MPNIAVFIEQHEGNVKKVAWRKYVSAFGGLKEVSPDFTLLGHTSHLVFLHPVPGIALALSSETGTVRRAGMLLCRLVFIASRPIRD